MANAMSDDCSNDWLWQMWSAPYAQFRRRTLTITWARRCEFPEADL